jgi:hypothetical protein
MDLPEYKYVPLQDNHIRVLLLQPASQYDAPLIAKLQHIVIVPPHPYTGHRDIPDFVAISYAWRTQPTTAEPAAENAQKEPVQAHTGALVLQGSMLTSVKIRPNVDIMFRYLRFADRERCIWIDALCINQNDDEEKAAQVSFMGEIYQSARAVVIWLGPPADACDRVGQLFEDLVKYAELPNIPERVATWGSLRTFLDRSWFRRRWT